MLKANLSICNSTKRDAEKKTLRFEKESKAAKSDNKKTTNNIKKELNICNNKLVEAFRKNKELDNNKLKEENHDFSNLEIKGVIRRLLNFL